MTNQEKVQQFMETFGQEVRKTPGWCDDDTLDLRLLLIEEEVEELHQGCTKGDFSNVAKELVDILYVVYGMGLSLGINLDECFQEVHRSNMSKLEDGKVLYRNDGKVMKGKYYTTADIQSIVGHP